MMDIMYAVKRFFSNEVRDMKVSREQAAANRERILDVASRLFRERGLDGIGVADLMQGAGLTHGGFYGHFASKEELMALACDRALSDSLERWRARAARGGKNPLPAIAKPYLSTRHRDDPGAGCALAALGAEVSRHAPPVRRAFTEGLRPLVDVLADAVPGKTRAARRRKALAIVAGMVGALVLARAVDDSELSQEILKAAEVAVESTAD
jgi:TetR/AcrR family transcriptional repressor of nem operon